MRTTDRFADGRKAGNVRSAAVAAAILAAAVAAAATAASAGDDRPELARTLRVVGRARTASQPKGVTLSPDGRTLLVTNFGQGAGRNIYLYDAETLERSGTIHLRGASAVESVWSPDGTTAYVSDFANDEVLFVDPVARSVRLRATVARHPKVLALAPDGSRLFASCWSDTVSVVDTATGATIGHVRVGDRPRGLAVSPDGARVYVVNFGSHDMHELNASTPAVLRRADLGAGSHPRHAVLDRSGRRLYVSLSGIQAVHVVDTETLRVVESIPVGRCPKTIVLSPDERYLYSADFGSDDVSVIDLATRGSRRVAVEGIRSPCGLAIRGDGARLWVTGWDSRDIVALEPLDP